MVEESKSDTRTSQQIMGDINSDKELLEYLHEIIRYISSGDEKEDQENMKMMSKEMHKKTKEFHKAQAEMEKKVMSEQGSS
jgi:hypothetical protein